jgi:phospholipase/carboxylesterase
MAKGITTYTSFNIENLKENSPVAILLHGYGADENDLPEIMTGNLPWVSPRAPLSSGGNGFQWYLLTVNNYTPQEDIERATEKLWEWIDNTLPATSPLVPIGFSQGALMATQLLRTRPERVLKTVLMAGFILDAKQPADDRLEELKPDVLYCRGEADTRISAEMVERTSNWLTKHTKLTAKVYSDLGHSVDNRVIRDLSEYLTKRT